MCLEHNIHVSLILCRYCPDFQFTEEDGLPTKLCGKCVLQASKAFAFRQQCIQSNLTLRLHFHPPEHPIKTYGKSANKSYVGQLQIVTDNEDDKNETVEILEEVEQDEEIDEEEIDIYDRSISSDEENSQDMEMGDSESVEYVTVMGSDEFEDGVSLLQAEDSGDDKSTDRPSGERNGKAYKCEDCGKVLSNFGSYKYHKQLHSDKTPYLCSQCGIGFKTKNAYDGHMITHDDNNPNKCQVCGKTYRQPASLTNHLRSHTGEKVGLLL